MRDWLRILKPAAPARVHLLAASLMWTVVGGGLLFFGIRWTRDSQITHVWPLVAAAASIGLLKSRLVLDRVARRAVQRIRTRGDGRCIGGFLSVRTWAFVILMASCGHLMRGGLLPYPAVGLIYIAVGMGLLFSVRWLWRAWLCYPRVSSPES